MPLTQSLREHIAACFTGLWVQSHEHEDALAEIARLCREQHWSLATWDIDRGLQLGGNPSAAAARPAPTAVPSAADPVAAVRALASLARPDGSALLVLPNFHRFLQSAEVVQTLAHAVSAGKSARTFIVVLSPLVQIPTELEKAFVVLEHDLPDRDQLRQIAAGIATEPGELPEGEHLDRLADFRVGTLADDEIAAPVASQQFGLDALGNWTTFTTPASPNPALTTPPTRFRPSTPAPTPPGPSPPTTRPGISPCCRRPATRANP